jgi:hypothetical protein
MNRKIFLSTVVVTSLLLLNCSDKEMEVTEEQKEQMRTTAADFMDELKGILLNQVQTNGVVSALDVCSDTAQVLTNEFGLQRGVFIKRVSVKNRNTNNFPDDYEQNVLNSFQEMLQNKKLNGKTELAELVNEGEFTYLRYLKPILVQPECLNCHGSENTMLEEVSRLIAERYPNDKALDYKPGELRGAVSIKKLIE